MVKRLCLSKTDKKIGGVCGGLADYFNIDSSLLRLGWVLLILMFRGWPLILYLICWAILPVGLE